MKIITNEDNPATLKLIIAANLGRVHFTLETVAVKDWKPRGIRRLPVLELPDGNSIFSANAAARFLCESNDDEKVAREVDYWLEWDAISLQPALYFFNPEKPADSTLLRLLNHVEEKLAKNTFLVNNEVSLADYVVWSSLFGVLTHKTVTSQYMSDKTNTLKWFTNVRKLEVVKHAETSQSTGKFKTGVDAIKAFAETTWFPGPPSSTASQKNVPENEDDVVHEVSSDELERSRQAWNKDHSTRPKPETFKAPVLPKRDKKNILITSALPYVNNVPHLGNIIGCVLSADVFARYCRLRNWNTLYVCGTDEFGTATETKALEEKLTPQQICDKYFKIHKETYAWFNIEFDSFGRTTTSQQKEITQELFWGIHNKGYTFVESMEQLLCEACDRFLADRFVEGTCPKCKYEDARGDQCDGCGQLINAVELIKPRCKICNNMPVVRNSEHIFFDLPKIEPELRKWIESTSDRWTHNSRSITNTWLKDGLKPRCITRDLKWGTPVPLKGFENKVFYVWFDAPFGYISITACYTKEWRKWWQPSEDTPVTYYEFMAKDNVPFHAVMFPSTLIAIDERYKLVDHIMATEYLNYEDGKFSKSRGIGVFGTDARDTGLPADIFRFYLLYVRPESQDTSFSWDDFVSKHNNELLNNIGNFVNRALLFTQNFFESTIPKMTLNDDDYAILALVNRELVAYHNALEKATLRDGIKYILNISRHGNQYMQNMKPWTLIKKSDDEKARAGTIVGLLSNLVALLAVTIRPYMPIVSETMLKQMNASHDILVLTDEVTILLPEGHKIGQPAPLFTKIEPHTVESLKSRFAGKQKSSSPATADQGKTEAYKNIASVREMEAAVLEQGNKVRQMKSSGVEKSVWMVHVQVLNDMKKQLEELKKANETSPKDTSTDYNSITSVEKMEAIVAEQGNLVRQMKSSNVEKSVWMPHVEVLKNMKSHLENLKKTSGADETPSTPVNGQEEESVAPSSKSKKKRNKSAKVAAPVE